MSLQNMHCSICVCISNNANCVVIPWESYCYVYILLFICASFRHHCLMCSSDVIIAFKFSLSNFHFNSSEVFPKKLFCLGDISCRQHRTKYASENRSHKNFISIT